MNVTFFLDEPVEPLVGLDPDRDWRQLQRGEHAWILQTYLRLAQVGLAVRLQRALPPEGIVVFHAKQRAAVHQQRDQRADLLFVEVLGDIRPARGSSHVEVVQNAASADNRRRFFLPHWPQPGLRPREAARGTRVERIAYKGFDLNLHPYFRSAAWHQFLHGRGLTWIADSVPYAGAATAGDRLEWPDFTTVDVIVAVRPKSSRLGMKPATKLYNAWLAGVPAVLGSEVGFVEARRSSLDYLEIGTPEAACAAVGRLQDEPDLYRDMVAHGLRRGAEFAVASSVARWSRFLSEFLPAHAAELRAPLAGRGGWWARARRWLPRS
jgi:hypothetical protein